MGKITLNYRFITQGYREWAADIAVVDMAITLMVGPVPNPLHKFFSAEGLCRNPIQYAGDPL